VRQGLSSKRVARWFLGSLLLRMGIALAGFYLVSGGHWEQLLLCLLGFVLARLVGTWLMQPSRVNRPPQALEGRHAP
jgi:F1F0 ATPase subunit 2